MDARISSERSYAVTIFTPGGSPGSISFSLAFTRSITAQRVLALPHHHDARDHFALAVEIGHAAAHVRAQRHRAHVAHQDRHARWAGRQRDVRQVRPSSARSRARAPCTRGR